MRATITALPPRAYAERDFWNKLAGFAVIAGHQVIEKALWLYYAAEGPETPKWAKATVYGALAYFILPADVVPDLVPLAGYTDDLTVLTLAVTTIGCYVDQQVKDRTAATLTRWFPGAIVPRDSV